MEEKNMEKKIISEEDLEKAAISGGITEEQLMRALGLLGLLVGEVAGAAAGLAAKNYISNKKKGEKQ